MTNNRTGQEIRSLPLTAQEWQRLDELAAQLGAVATRGKNIGQPVWRSLILRLARGEYTICFCHPSDITNAGSQ